MLPNNRLTHLQQRRNTDSLDGWRLAESHRRQVTQLLVDRKVATHPTLCVLGAGNCNDLDLQQLATVFQRTELVDIDLTALDRGMTAQSCLQLECFNLQGNCDVTGVWQQLAQLTSDADASEVDQLIATATAWPGLTGLGTHGTVASTCLLSQLIDGVIHALGQSHPRCLEVIAAIRQRHLRLLCELTAPGGNALLVTDFVSSDTASALPSLSGQALADTLMQMISQHNFFTGLNPFRLQSLFTEDPYLADKIEAIHCQQPWLWNFGSRHYAVTAISFQRR